MDIGFIGTGNMGGALIRGYAQSNDQASIYIFDSNQDQLLQFKNLPKVNPTKNLEELIRNSDIIVLAVKPNIFEVLLPQIKAILNDNSNSLEAESRNKTFVSIAAGISINYIKTMLGEATKVIRTMPNLNSMVGQGMTAVSSDNLVSKEDFSVVLELFNTVGKTITVEENMIDTVIGVSGSSPAYAFMYMNALIKCAVKHGMKKEDALTFAAQSTLGAAVTVMESGIDPEILTQNVCSPGGTTIEAVNKLNELEFEGIIEEAMEAAINKSKIMTK
jgi:pyrroline-5-carboxylate reductase